MILKFETQKIIPGKIINIQRNTFNIVMNVDVWVFYRTH